MERRQHDKQAKFATINIDPLAGFTDLPDVPGSAVSPLPAELNVPGSDSSLSDMDIDNEGENAESSRRGDSAELFAAQHIRDLMRDSVTRFGSLGVNVPTPPLQGRCVWVPI